MTYSSDRTIDQKAEHEVHVYLNKYFYPAFQDTMEPAGRQEQLDGIDMHICIQDKWATIDEKAQLTRLNQEITDITTQAIEIWSKMKNGIYRTGWIYNENSKTDYYLFMYITKCGTEFKSDLTCDKIECVRAVLISKAKIIEMIRNEGFSLRNILLFGKALIKGCFHYEKETKKRDKVYLHKYLKFPKTTRNLWFCFTAKGLSEEPVNCVIKWSLYEKYAWKVYDITPSGVVDLKDGGKVVWQIQKN